MAITQISYTTDVIVTEDDIPVNLKTASISEVKKVAEEVVIIIAIKRQIALKEKAYSMLTCFIQRYSLALLCYVLIFLHSIKCMISFHVDDLRWIN
jgi:hypothetical protein